MITFRTSADIPSDRRVVLTLPGDTPVGKADLVVMVAPQSATSSARGHARRHFGTVHSGDPQSADNDRIDAELARAYADSHE